MVDAVQTETEKYLEKKIQCFKKIVIDVFLLNIQTVKKILPRGGYFPPPPTRGVFNPYIQKIHMILLLLL